MKILQVHNFYQQRGGEDSVFQSEYELLREHAHVVVRYTAHNDALESMSPLRATWTTVWNSRSYREVKSLLAQHSIDVVHAHNTFPLISPSIYYAAHAAGIPVVQTLHNYRLLCPGSTLFREGHICEECVGKLPYRGALHGCYRQNKAASTVVAGMLMAHRAAGTWTSKVQTYIALTKFARDIFIKGGLPAERIAIKPNCLATDPGIGTGTGGYALFAGRLSPEKGIRELLDAWALLPSPYPLIVAGDGALREWVQNKAAALSSVQYVGPRSHDQILALVKGAVFVTVPSSWYEGLPMTIIEAFACGTPVLTSRLPSMDDLVQQGVNGYRFLAGNAANLAREITMLLQDPTRFVEMRRAARATYESNFTAEHNYKLLEAIYKQSIEARTSGKRLRSENDPATRPQGEEGSKEALIRIQKA